MLNGQTIQLNYATESDSCNFCGLSISNSISNIVENFYGTTFGKANSKFIGNNCAHSSVIWVHLIRERGFGNANTFANYLSHSLFLFRSLWASLTSQFDAWPLSHRRQIEVLTVGWQANLRSWLWKLWHGR